VEEQDRKLQEQETVIAQRQKEFQSTIARQQKQIEALSAGLQKVNEQLQVSKPTPQLVANLHAE
jgi:hypothetical protein